MEYTVVIRTLGTAGEKYQRELDSLCAQTVPPKKILVYIAEGYPIPKETCGREHYIYVKKGMVRQRALCYDEVMTDYILFLDDDVYLPPDGVENLINAMIRHNVDVISPNTFENHKMGKATLLRNMLLGKIMPFRSETWSYKMLLSGGFSFNINPTKDFYLSESNAGPCFLCRKYDFLRIRLQDDLWLDEAPYSLPEDQVMFYKMYLAGLRIGTLFNSGIVHLDAGTSVSNNSERTNKILYSEVRNQTIFWYKYIRPNTKGFKQLRARFALKYYQTMRMAFALKTALRGDYRQLKIVRHALHDANEYIFKSTNKTSIHDCLFE